MEDSTKPEHLNTSALGTRAYWDSAYTTERSNFSVDPSDEGTIWFSDAGAEERMLSFLENLADEDVLHKEADGEVANGEEDPSFTEPTRFLDLGTGNGHLLFALREEGWEGEMVGVDYSAQSVRLAEEIKASKGAECEDVQFHEFDILGASAAPDWLGEGFDVVLDKGTFDAISLSEEKDAQGRRIVEGYKAAVEPLVKKGGRFLITSCNWTEEEVKGWFEGGELEYEGKAEYPSFTFGGKTGSSVCTLCFKRR
ncbi:Protein-lysine N-methyltransferase efm4 [Paraconiothyrium brasiliense]|uniref:Protein-lysine N-methyltransferase EFM4 n=1 Tax=Paraconiothyrium brasiliense TaxID=300254 RepID=A0ABR3R8H2_9PLEO